MGKQWFWSDPHLGHGNIINLSGRPFDDVEQMNAALIDNVNAAVADDDTLWVLGDVVMGPFTETMALISRIRGRKILVAGNHDKCFAGHKRNERFVEVYRQAGFDVVHQHQATTHIGARQVQLCHFPFVGDSGESERYVEWRPKDRGQWLIHGHVHGSWRVRRRMINIGVDAWAGRPVSEDTVASLISAGPADLARLEWTA